MVESFWAIPELTTMRTPLSILREQAGALTEQTHGALVGIVEADKGKGYVLVIRLEVSVPALNDYRYRILTYEQPIDLYPGILYGPDDSISNPVNESDFTSAIKEALSSPRVKNVLTSLLSQVTAA